MARSLLRPEQTSEEKYRQAGANGSRRQILRPTFEPLEDRCLLSLGPQFRKDINLDTNGSDPDYLTNVNGTLFFSAFDEHGNELWKSDGTATGTVLLADMLPGSGSSFSSRSAFVAGFLSLHAPRFLMKGVL